MKELSKIFKDTEIKVEIIDGRNMYFNVSGIANKFGKKTSEWKNQKSTKEYIKIVGKATNLNETELIRQIGNDVKIHNKLFVHFARFVNLEFSYVADEMIYDILTGDKKVVDQKLLFKDNVIKEKDIAIAKLKESTYGKVRGNGFETVFRIIQITGADISATDFNKILVEEEILLKDKCISCGRFDLKDDGISSMIADGSIVVHVDTAKQILVKHNIKSVDESQSMIDFK